MNELANDRLKEDQALSLLTNRIVLDFISLLIDRGDLSISDAQKLVRFSANEVKRGAPWLDNQVDFFADVIERRFDETEYSDKAKP